jgi:hypothetical protein
MRSEEDRVRSNSVPEHRDTGYWWSRNNWSSDWFRWCTANLQMIRSYDTTIHVQAAELELEAEYDRICTMDTWSGVLNLIISLHMRSSSSSCSRRFNVLQQYCCCQLGSSDGNWRMYCCWCFGTWGIIIRTWCLLCYVSAKGRYFLQLLIRASRGSERWVCICCLDEGIVSVKRIRVGKEGSEQGAGEYVAHSLSLHRSSSLQYYKGQY